ncbi:hypothetical protein BO78DRAFT_402124 [Aspergillus sclerotiicarbonarius CBS 121057]|uniref:Uncharacterized protein n=1 Tax=Aspergillus sclerotiicarbonarius (strain CBS 121057 / IBT 28362) TaxID=1448318 RepID=A0A319E1P0_ASPSB|nr:hypothetical protein BO78DRAFT_402124 [Aspergillus sclerotiicarbonarius CBS 121057]
MTWTTFEHLMTVCAVITTIITIARVAIDIRTWHRKRQTDIRARFVANRQDSPTPILDSIQPLSPIDLDFRENQGALGEGIRLEDLGEEGRRV